MQKLEAEREKPEGIDDGVSGQRKHVERIAQMVGLTVSHRGRAFEKHAQISLSSPSMLLTPGLTLFTGG